jgi:hypothetical protein
VAHPASDSIKHVSFLLSALMLLFMTTAPSTAPAQSFQELESALKSCQADWDRLNNRIRQNCPYVGATDDACDMWRDAAAMKKEVRTRLLNTPMTTRPSESAIQQKTSWCYNLRSNYYGCSLAVGGRDAEASCGHYLQEALQCEREVDVLRGPGPYPRDPGSKEIVELDAQIEAYERQYSACLQAAPKREECLRLQGQLKSVAASCDEIKGRLQAASGGRPQQETYGGTLHTFIVRCKATEVKPGDTVSCTANGIYSSNLNKELDLTNDPATQWQNGPRVSTTNLRPGQTFRVIATRGGISDGVTIRVTGDQPDQNTPQSTGEVRMSRSGGSTQETGKQATYQARVEDPQATNQTLYAYYWYLNGQNKTSGYNQTSFSFAIQRGKNTVMVRVLKTSDRGRTWQKVGNATDSFEAQGQSVGTDISIDGRYAGSLGGGASGSIQFTVNGGSLSGNVAGTYDGDPFHATLSGSVDRVTGGMQATLTGTVGGYAFNGTVSGQIRAGTAAGSWNAQNQYTRSSGSWQAAK